MRIAVFADIHGNLAAFEAALAHVRTLGIDQLVIAGDLINGAADSRHCWDLAQTLDCILLRGNHERYVFDLDTSNAPPLWKSEQFGPVQWTAAQFSSDERAQMANLPLTAQLLSMPDLLIMHASPQIDNVTVSAYTPADTLDQLFGDTQATMLVRGHNHLCQIRPWQGRQIVTIGSVGMPLDGHLAAQYLLLEKKAPGWEITHHAVPYDVEHSIQRFYDSGYLAEAGPMARLLLREIATAAPQIVPFLRHFARWQQADKLSLTNAVERFLTLY
jgi:predicted phosphodiesterase